jgi:hypothetical protein
VAETTIARTQRTRTTREYRVDENFLALLEEDFGIDQYGVPPAPQKQAIALCEWAIRSAKGDVDEAGNALRAWARKNGCGQYDRRLLEAPEITYDDNDYLRSIGRL